MLVQGKVTPASVSRLLHPAARQIAGDAAVSESLEEGGAGAGQGTLPLARPCCCTGCRSVPTRRSLCADRTSTSWSKMDMLTANDLWLLRMF